MKKATLLILLSLLSLAPLMAQSPCFNASFDEGVQHFNAGRYKQAKQSFNEAKNCPDPDEIKANDWIKKCNDKIREQENQKLEREAAQTAYMNVRQVDYCNVEKGKMIDDYGADLYPSKLKELQPRITYDGRWSETKSAKVFIKVYNPNGILVTGQNSPPGYTYSASIQVPPGNGRTILLPTWNNNGLPFSTGKYKMEFWCNDNQFFTSYFNVKADIAVVSPPKNDDPQKKVAEIKVMGSSGYPLDGAKLLVVGTRKHELTNSDGVGRIDMSDGSSKRIEVSHPDYLDKKEINVKPGDKQNVYLYQPKTEAKSGFGVADYIVPGLGELRFGSTYEGIAFMGGEVVLLTSGIISNSIANKQLKVMQNENVTLADFQSARSKYKTQRVVNIVSYTTAVVLYGAHLYRAFTIADEYKSGKRISMSPTLMNVGDEMAVGMNINITF